MDVHFDEASISLDGHLIVDRLTLDVGEGRVVGLIGPNGSGKTTALRCVYRALKPSRGRVRVGEHDVSALSLRESAQHVAALTQEGGTDLDFTVEEIVGLGRTPHLRGNEPLSARDWDLCRDAMAQLDVLHLAERGVLTLSGGERQRVLMARALAQEPTVLVLDEPTNHLDLRHQIGLLSLLKDAGLTVLITLHDLNLAAATCDRLAVLSRGRLVAAGTAGDILTSTLLRDVFGVDATVVSHPLTGDPQLLFALSAAQPMKGSRQ